MIRNTIHFLEQNNHFQFPNNFGWLHNVAPTFPMHGEQVSILRKPEEFYQTLLERCKASKRRIMLASLYLGTGPLEKELVQVINSKMKEIKDLKVNILLDANRGSRGKENSRTMLLPLVQNPSQCKVSLFHTPSLRGPLKYLLPPRYNELVGLQHMKLYLFDDSVIISGANLSEDYFTNRQDRYILISECKELANFYWDLVQNISSVSLSLNKYDSVVPPIHHPYKSRKSDYIGDAKSKIWGFYNNSVLHNNNTIREENSKTYDTWIFPLLELPPLGVHQDSEVTSHLLETAEKGSKITISTGYFNLTDTYSDTILYKSQAQYRILMAHPSANGFLKASGLAGGIPSAYTGLALKFLESVTSAKMNDRISMFEYVRPGWTFHAKGLWYTPPKENLPVMTLIGSSNFGSRSVRRDLETQATLVTFNNELRKKLAEEEEELICLACPFTEAVASDPQRKPALWVSTRPAGNIKCYKLEEEHNDKFIKKREVSCPDFLREKPSAGESPSLGGQEDSREERKRRIFEGLLHFATVVNHIDTFIMDKGKLILRSLGKMAEEKEDPRFNM